MIDALVIDTTDQITSLLLGDNACIQRVDDEVKALNVIDNAASVVVLLHYNVRKEQTEEYVKLIVNTNAKSKVVVIADKLDEETVLACLLAGAQGYQSLSGLKQYSNKLLAAMNAGEAWITRRMTATLLETLRAHK